MKRSLLAFIVTASLIPTIALAQGTIKTDQPDQSNRAYVVDHKQFQVESSIYVNAFKGSSTAVVSSSLIRYGIGSRVEARLLVEQGYHRDLYISETAHATSPLAIGAKVSLLKEQKRCPPCRYWAGCNCR